MLSKKKVFVVSVLILLVVCLKLTSLPYSFAQEPPSGSWIEVGEGTTLNCAEACSVLGGTCVSKCMWSGADVCNPSACESAPDWQKEVAGAFGSIVTCDAAGGTNNCSAQVSGEFNIYISTCGYAESSPSRKLFCCCAGVPPATSVPEPARLKVKFRDVSGNPVGEDVCEASFECVGTVTKSESRSCGSKTDLSIYATYGAYGNIGIKIPLQRVAYIQEIITTPADVVSCSGSNYFFYGKPKWTIGDREITFVISETPVPSPTPTPYKISCGGGCLLTSDCEQGLVCDYYCFNPACRGDFDCVCDTPTPTPSPSCLHFFQGDANCDDYVNYLDYVLWWQSYFQDTGADFNDDGVSDDLDYVIWWQNYGLAPSPTP